MCYTEEWYEEWCPTYFCCHHDLIMLHAICTNICISAWIGSTSARSPTLVSKLIILNKFEVFKEMHFVRSKDAPHECCIQQQKVRQNFDAPKWPYIFFSIRIIWSCSAGLPHSLLSPAPLAFLRRVNREHWNSGLLLCCTEDWVPPYIPLERSHMMWPKQQNQNSDTAAIVILIPSVF